MTDDQWIQEPLELWCTDCDASVPTRPVELLDETSADGNYLEVRHCEAEHEIRREARFSCPPGEATSWYRPVV